MASSSADFHCAIEFRFGPLQVPVQYAFGLSEVYMRFGLLVVQLQSANGGLANFRIRFKRRYISVREPQPYLRDSRPRAAELGIFLQRALKKFKASPQRFLGACLRVKETLQISVIGIHVAR